MTTTTNNTTISTKDALAKIKEEITTLERKKNLYQTPVHYINATEDAKYVHVAKTLMPLIRAFKRDGDRFIFPDGQRVRFGKIRFSYRGFDKPNASWGDYLFHASTTSWCSEIKFSFKELYSEMERLTSYNVNTKEYHFNPVDFHMINSVSYFLKSHSNEEIEQIALYGFRANKKAFADKAVREKIDAKIKELKSIKKQLANVAYYEEKKATLIEMVVDEKKRDRVAADWIGHGARSLY